MIRILAIAFLFSVISLPAICGELDSRTTAYRIAITTGECANAGTDAAVTIKIIGDQGETDRVYLDTPGAYDDHERGNTDCYVLNASVSGFAGRPQSIILGHNNGGDNPGWYVERIKIDTLNGSQTVYQDLFKIEDWLASDVKDDPRIEKAYTKELPAITVQKHGDLTTKVVKTEYSIHDFRGSSVPEDLTTTFSNTVSKSVTICRENSTTRSSSDTHGFSTAIGTNAPGVYKFAMDYRYQIDQAVKNLMSTSESETRTETITQSETINKTIPANTLYVLETRWLQTVQPIDVTIDGRDIKAYYPLKLECNVRPFTFKSDQKIPEDILALVEMEQENDPSDPDSVPGSTENTPPVTGPGGSSLPFIIVFTIIGLFTGVLLQFFIGHMRRKNRREAADT